MTIDEDGFLSSDIAQTRERNRAQHPDSFGMVTEINRIAQSVLPSVATLDGTTKNSIACGCYIRALQNLQGAVLMAEHSMMSEAYTLVRSGLESLFYLGAAIRADDIEMKLTRDQVTRVRKVIGGYQRAVPEGDPDIDTDALEAVLRATLPDGVDPAQVSMESFAKQAQLSTLYDGLYRPLSLAHAHPSLISLASIRGVSGDRTHSVQWGPDRGDPDKVKDVLSLTFAVMYYLLAQWARLLEQNQQPVKELHKRILEIGEKYHELVS
jgi:Family of unknown function (DUF5677)